MGLGFDLHAPDDEFQVQLKTAKANLSNSPAHLQWQWRQQSHSLGIAHNELLLWKIAAMIGCLEFRRRAPLPCKISKNVWELPVNNKSSNQRLSDGIFCPDSDM